MEDDKLIKKQRLIIYIISIVIVLALVVVVLLNVVPNLKEYINDPILFREYIKENGIIGVLIFLIVQVLQVVISIIPGEMIEIAAGISFGWLLGLILCMLGIALATCLIFYACKKLGKPYIDRLVGKGKLKAFDRLNHSKKRDQIIFMIYFIPGIPKDLLTYAAGFFDIKLSKFLIISVVARIPSIVTSTIAGHYILEGNYKPVILIFSIMFVITAISYITYSLISKKIKNTNEQIDNDSNM